MTQAGDSTAEITVGQAKFYARANCLSVAVAFGILAFDVVRYSLTWLRYGDAKRVNLVDWTGMPHVKWLGVQRIITFFWNLPISVVAVLALMLFGSLWNYYDEEAKRLGKSL